MTNTPSDHRSHSFTSIRISLLALVGVWLLIVALPQSSAAQTVEEPIRIVNVAHDAGGPMTVTFEASSTSLESLTVHLNGETVAYNVTASEATAPRIVLAIENSASLTAAHRAQVQTAALSLIDALGADTEVAIVSFGGGTDIASTFTSDRDALSSAIGSLQSGGGAALYSGVSTAAQLAGEGAGASLIVVITYGWDWGALSTTDRETSLADAQGSGAPVYVQSMVLFGEDVAYLNALSVDRSIHNLTELQALANASGLIASAETASHTSTTIKDAGLLAITFGDLPADGSPLPLSVSANAELAAATFTASLNGETLAIAPDGSLNIDPWQFAPGDTPIEVRALLGETVIATASSSITIPTLEPVISAETDADSSKLVATVVAQPGTISQLVASVDGNVIATSSSTTIELDLPAEATVTITAQTTDGSVLASRSVASTERAVVETGANVPYQLIAAALIVLTASATLAVWWQRRPRTTPAPQTPPVNLAVVEDESPSATPPPVPAPAPTPTHKPVKLHPVGNWEIIVRPRGGQERRLPLGPGAISVGASPLCDITVRDGDVRFVHAVIGPDGPQLRIHRFGPVILDGRQLKVEDSVLGLDTTLMIGDTLLSIGAQGQIHDTTAAA